MKKLICLLLLVVCVWNMMPVACAEGNNDDLQYDMDTIFIPDYFVDVYNHFQLELMTLLFDKNGDSDELMYTLNYYLTMEPEETDKESSSEGSSLVYKNNDDRTILLYFWFDGEADPGSPAGEIHLFMSKSLPDVIVDCVKTAFSFTIEKFNPDADSDALYSWLVDEKPNAIYQLSKTRSMTCLSSEKVSQFSIYTVIVR